MKKKNIKENTTKAGMTKEENEVMIDNEMLTAETADLAEISPEEVNEQLEEKEAKDSSSASTGKYHEWWEKIENPDVAEINNAIKCLNEADASGKQSDVMEVYNAIALINEDFEEDINAIKNRLRVIEKRADREIDDTLGLTIKHYREERGLTLQDVSEKAGVSVSYIHRIEKGKRRMPSYPILEKIANALGISVARLLPNLKEGNTTRTKLSDVLISNEIFAQNQATPISFEEKELIGKLIDVIYESEWEEERAKELLKITEIISDIKRAYNERAKSPEKKGKSKRKAK